MSNQLEHRNQNVPAEIMEKVAISGDLKDLTSAERVSYYGVLCNSLGLNPLTKPFDYITLNGKLTLYAKRDATDQLRKIYQVSVMIVSRELIGDIYVVTARASTPNARMDESTGAISVKGLSADALANAYMKAETKAKRRVTLSIVGLGWLDETEVQSIPNALPEVEKEIPDNIITISKVDSSQLHVQGLPDDPPAILKEAAALGAVVGEIDPLSWARNAMVQTSMGDMRLGDMTREQLQHVAANKNSSKDMVMAAKALLDEMKS